jgi:hypothetical protein
LDGSDDPITKTRNGDHTTMRLGTIIAAILMIAATANIQAHAVGANTGETAGGNAGGNTGSRPAGETGGDAGMSKGSERKSGSEGMTGKSTSRPSAGSTSAGAGNEK